MKCANCKEDVVNVFETDSRTWQWHHIYWARSNAVYDAGALPVNPEAYKPHLVLDVVCPCGCNHPIGKGVK